jgi:hypothetical protein
VWQRPFEKMWDLGYVSILAMFTKDSKYVLILVRFFVNMLLTLVRAIRSCASPLG